MQKEKPFDDISAHIDEYERTASTHCEPIYLMRNNGINRHDKDTESATITYIKLDGHYYGVTCAHVANAREDGSEDAPLLVPTVWGRSANGFAFRSNSENALAGEFKVPDRHRLRPRGLDIAIARLSQDFVLLHMQQKDKTPLDLDNWQLPNWSEIRTCATWGYPDRQKSSSGAIVSAKLLTTILELQSQPMPSDREDFLLFSNIPESDGICLSGVSGSAVYCLHNDGNMTPIGIIYEGNPGSYSKKANDKVAVYGPTDFQIQAYVLSPTIFRNWLELAGLVSSDNTD